MMKGSQRHHAVRLVLIVVVGALSGCGDNDNASGGPAFTGIEFRCPDRGDRRIVHHGDKTELVPPASLEAATDGVTVTVFPPVTQSVLGLAVHLTFTSRGHVGECTVTGNSHLHVVAAGDRLGLAAPYSQRDLELVVERLTRTPVPGADNPCADITGVADLSIGTVRVMSTGPGEPIAVDGIAIGASVTTFPTLETPLPGCL